MKGYRLARGEVEILGDIPPEYAQGIYATPGRHLGDGPLVKVAQRIAVRITIDPNQPLAQRLRPGMSVVARIKTDRR